MKRHLFHILNERARLERKWQIFREWERAANESRRKDYMDSHGSLRVPSVEDCISPRDNTKIEKPLDGKLQW